MEQIEGIDSYQRNGKTFYSVRVSKRVPGLAKRFERAKFGLVTKDEALRFKKKLTTELYDHVAKTKQEGGSFGKLLEAWVLAAKSGDIFVGDLKPTTLHDYEVIIRTYADHWLSKTVVSIDAHEAWTLLNKVESEVSIARRKRLRTAIDSVFRWGITTGKVKGLIEIPTKGYKSHKTEVEKLPEILTLDEMKTLLRLAKVYDHPWFPIWTLALYTGMRSGELYALEWSSVDFDKQCLYVHKNWTNRVGFGPTKGRYWRTVPLSEHLIAFLKELKLQRGTEKSVLPRFKEWRDGEQAAILRQFCDGVGITSIKFHTLRACFATKLMADGIAPGVVMKICGWKDSETMARYVRLAGVEVAGATDGLKLLPDTEVMGRVVELLRD